MTPLFTVVQNLHLIQLLHTKHCYGSNKDYPRRTSKEAQKILRIQIMPLLSLTEANNKRLIQFLFLHFSSTVIKKVFKIQKSYSFSVSRLNIGDLERDTKALYCFCTNCLIWTVKDQPNLAQCHKHFTVQQY